MQLNQKIITPDVSGDSDKVIAEAIAAFEAYLYEVERGKKSSRLKNVVDYIKQAKESFQISGHNNVVDYCKALIELVAVVEQTEIDKAGDQHGVLLGGMNQLINYLQLQHFVEDDISPLRAVLDDIRVACGSEIDIPNFIYSKTAALDELSVEVVFNENGNYSWRQIGSLLQDCENASTCKSEKIASFSKRIDAQQLISAGSNVSILKDILLGIKALLPEPEASVSYSPATAAIIDRSFMAVGELAAATDDNYKADQLPALVRQLRELLTVIVNRGCDNPAAASLCEKYQLGANGVNESAVCLRLGTPDKQTVEAFLANVEADLVILQTAVENLPLDPDWQASTTQLFNFAVNLRHASVLAEHGDVAKHFQRLGESLHLLSNSAECDQDIVENIASELVMVSERLAYHQRTDGNGSTSDALVQLLGEALDNCQLALEADNLTSTTGEANSARPVAQIEKIIDSFSHAMQAAQFLSNTQVALVIADSVCTAQSCLLSLVDNPRPLIERQLLDTFIESLGHTKQLIVISNVVDDTAMESSLNLARRGLRDLQALYSQADVSSSEDIITIPALPTELTKVEGKAEVEIESNIAAQNDFDLDEEIVEIFLEEAEEVFELIDTRQAQIAEHHWNDNPTLIVEQLRDLRRAYHTLKGSGRMAGATYVAEASWEIESMLNRVLDNSIKFNPQRMMLLTISRVEIGNLLACFDARNTPDINRYDQLLVVAKQLSSDEDAAASESLLQAFVESTSVESVTQAEKGNVEKPSIDHENFNSSGAEIIECTEVDDVNFEEFDGSVLDEEIDLQAAKQEPVIDEVEATIADRDNASLLDAGIDSVEQIPEQGFNDKHQSAADSNANDDDVLQSIFKDEASEQLAVLADYLDNCQADQPKIPGIALERALHTIAGGARVTGAQQVAQLMLPAEILVGQIRLRANITAEHYALLQQTKNWLERYLDASFASNEVQQSEANELADRLNQAIEGCFESEKPDNDFESESAASMNRALHNCKMLYQAEAILCRWRVTTKPPSDIAKLCEELESLQSVAGDFSAVIDLSNGILSLYSAFSESSLHYEAYTLARKAQLELEQMLDAMAVGIQPPPSHIVADLRLLVEEQKQLVERLQESTVDDESDPAENAANLVDDEIVNIFLEESHELLEELDVNINRWIAMQGDDSVQAEILRILHTIKGGARMAGLQQVGELCHNFEAFLQGLKLDAKSIDQKVCKRVSRELSELVTALNNAEDSTTTTEENTAAEQRDERPAEEYVRVQAAALEQLVGLAGETSISRSLIEERMNGFAYAIEEIESTVERLNEQLRRLEIETEAQINFRKEQVEIEGLEEFDPLEMDRYSHFQQLSRSLIESASDLQALKSTLVDKTRGVETLLLQQGRINTELQEGLIRTRTVPLSRSMVPRLRRTIRQVSGELDKPVNFEIANNEGELDRSVVERMVAPLEHILRNAIDHGIESAEQRIAANKPEVGTITLDLKREGGEVVISLTDDGKGIDVEAVRKKAIASGLIGEHDVLSNEEIMHFIFSRGFSTASSVTQISGRGIGMDAVQTEIRELGGTISLYSESGKGTTFIFRLPFTVSMNRALLVTAGGETLAVPIDAVEGVVRVSPYELNEYYGEQAVDFMYAGQRYDFSYLGAFINGSKPSYQSDMIGALPVLLVRTGEQLAALQVDRLLGSREIVVKSLGRQFSTLKSASGATILGDGSVVMIADLSALVRAPSSDIEAAETARQIQKGETTVMVVDDSVTVRKVTSRLLKRNNYEVMVAKDGLDAMAQLEEKMPDIILLDIEMPNLDGFEVVSRVRHDERLKHIPIVMISSRTGDKHRDRAISLGANNFLGKPYQDTMLLEVVAEYTNTENRATLNRAAHD